MNDCLEEFPPATEGQKTAPLPADEIMDIIYHSMLTTWEKKMIEQSFNYADSTIKEMTDFIEAMVEKTLSPRKKRKNLLQLQRNASRKSRKEKEKTPTQVS